MSLTGVAFIIAFAIGMWLTIARHPVYGLYTYIALFYLNPLSRWWGETLPDLRWSLVAAIVTLVMCLRLPSVAGRVDWFRTTPARALIFFTIWMWIQNIWALDEAQHLEASFLFTKYVLLFYLVYRLVDTPLGMWRFLLVHLVGCAYFGYLAFTANASGRLEGVGGPGIDDANGFAMHMDTGVVAGAMIALVWGGVGRWFAILIMPFILDGIIHSGSRGGFLALVGSALLIWYFYPRSSRKLFYVFATLAVVLFGVLARDPVFWERIQSMQAVVSADEAGVDDSALSRQVIAEAQLRMAQAYPLGTGHRGTATLSPKYIPDRFLGGPPENRRRASHNTFMSALVEQGIPGAFFYFWIWSWTVIASIKLKRLTAGPSESGLRGLLAAASGGLLVVFIAGIFGDYIKAEVQIWLWALLASLMAIARPKTASIAASVAVPATTRGHAARR